MKVCIYGAGAIRGDLAEQLHRAGADVSVVARREHLGATRWSGLSDSRRILQPSGRDDGALVVEAGRRASVAAMSAAVGTSLR